MRGKPCRRVFSSENQRPEGFWLNLVQSATSRYSTQGWCKYLLHEQGVPMANQLCKGSLKLVLYSLKNWYKCPSQEELGHQGVMTSSWVRSPFRFYFFTRCIEERNDAANTVMAKFRAMNMPSFLFFILSFFPGSSSWAQLDFYAPLLVKMYFKSETRTRVAYVLYAMESN